MDWKVVHIGETDSTNSWLRRHGGGEDMVVWADYQTAGRGQGSNAWESERGQNLTFSALLHPRGLTAQRQFSVSMAASLAIADALGQLIGDVSIKWPNDIYWRNAKIGGMLIEHRLQGSSVRDSIVGVGLNVNQHQFRSDAPNPVSLWQICGQETDREGLLRDILQRMERLMAAEGAALRERYMGLLYRRRGFHPYCDAEGAFMAELADVEDGGRLVLCDDNGRLRRYAFKEVTFVI